MTSATLAAPITEDDHAHGPANAAITLVQYGDYECPYTRLSRRSVHQLQREFGDSLSAQIRMVLQHAGLIHRRKQGREVLYQVDANRLDQAARAMAELVRQWE